MLLAVDWQGRARSAIARKGGGKHSRRPFGTPDELWIPPNPTLKRWANNHCAYGAGDGWLPACELLRWAYREATKHKALGIARGYLLWWICVPAEARMLHPQHRFMKGLKLLPFAVAIALRQKKDKEPATNDRRRQIPPLRPLLSRLT